MKDVQIAQMIEKEAQRQLLNIELIASEKYVSDDVLQAAGSILTNKYAEGYPSKRYYGGCFVVDEIEELARERAKKLFGAEHANVQPHSGAQANMAVYMSVLKPGDKELGMNLTAGGHLTHGHPLNFSGLLYQFIDYGVDPQSERIDYEAVRQIALKERPKLIVAGASAYPRVIDFAKSRKLPVTMHSCGFVEPLLPGMLRAGIDCLQVIEIKAGMDLLRIHQQYGDRLSLMGGIDVRTLYSNDRAVIDAELEAKIPTVKQGFGYCLHSDHSIPNTVEYDTYRYFIDKGLAMGAY